MSLRKLRTGQRLRVRVDCHLAKADATATVLYVRQELGYVVVEWDHPEMPDGPEIPRRTSELGLRDLDFFDVLP